VLTATLSHAGGRVNSHASGARPAVLTIVSEMATLRG
jgi:hypothetical protein